MSRLIEYKQGLWQVKYGPLEKSDFPKKKNAPWTVLVQNINHHFSFANSFLNLFKFIPYARLDDLMVSYATKNGSVGPHFDSYDVFLFQAKGEREWKISNQKEFSLDKKSAIKIITNFRSKNSSKYGRNNCSRICIRNNKNLFSLQSWTQCKSCAV